MHTLSRGSAAYAQYEMRRARMRVADRALLGGIRNETFIDRYHARRRRRSGQLRSRSGAGSYGSCPAAMGADAVCRWGLSFFRGDSAGRLPGGTDNPVGARKVGRAYTAGTARAKPRWAERVWTGGLTPRQKATPAPPRRHWATGSAAEKRVPACAGTTSLGTSRAPFVIRAILVGRWSGPGGQARIGGCPK
jgi:hypothetical protein